MTDWPNDDDGEVLAALEADGFDFALDHEVEYMVDFPSWPPAGEAITALAKFGETESFDPDDIDGYVVVTIRQKVSYETVTGTQRQLSAAAGPFGGNCEAWGVMH